MFILTQHFYFHCHIKLTMRKLLILACLIAGASTELLVKDNTYHSKLACNDFYDFSCGGRLAVNENDEEQMKTLKTILNDTVEVVRKLKVSHKLTM